MPKAIYGLSYVIAAAHLRNFANYEIDFAIPHIFQLGNSVAVSIIPVSIYEE